MKSKSPANIRLDIVTTDLTHDEQTALYDKLLSVVNHFRVKLANGQIESISGKIAAKVPPEGVENLSKEIKAATAMFENRKRQE